LRGCFLQVPEASSRFHARVPIGHASSRKRTPGRVIPRETWSGARDKASPPGARHLRRQGIPDAAADPPFTLMQKLVYISGPQPLCMSPNQAEPELQPNFQKQQEAPAKVIVHGSQRPLVRGLQASAPPGPRAADAHPLRRPRQPRHASLSLFLAVTKRLINASTQS
jgi:hypothetical protein